MLCECYLKKKIIFIGRAATGRYWLEHSPHLGELQEDSPKAETGQLQLAPGPRAASHSKQQSHPVLTALSYF